MKKFWVALTLAGFALVQGPVFAQQKKAEPAREEQRKADADKDSAKKNEQAEPKQEAKKKVKKGGC